MLPTIALFRFAAVGIENQLPGIKASMEQGCAVLGQSFDTHIQSDDQAFLQLTVRKVRAMVSTGPHGLDNNP